MEINGKKLEMDKLDSYIRVFDNVLPENNLKFFKKICEEHIDYEEATVINVDGSHEVVRDVRTVKTKGLSNLYDKSLTTVHWTSLLLYKFTQHIDKYANDFKMTNFQCAINDIQILKYTKGHHYKFHTDHNRNIPRTLSLIFFVNDDYEGGDLVFGLVGSTNTLVIEKKPNRLIIWPSNFMYPHCVKPVESGTRYSVVSWAL
jgi:predicted 2-oxoglutarate/Fe(II)-dependent dioxygenase YbiX